MSRAQISQAAYDHMAAWKGARPVLTLMGEFSAGKSTLLNFMVNMDAAPTKVTATHMPPTWFVQSETPFAVGLTWEGEERPVDLDCSETNFRDQYLIIRRGLNSAALAGCDIIDAPGISDPGLHKDELRFLSRYMDFVVWCTSANQAWRQTERAAFGKLAQAVRARSLLVVTRMDKLRSARDQEKVLKRVTTQAGPEFAAVFPMQTPKAAAVPMDARTDDPDGPWVLTGAHAFTEALAAACNSVTAKPAVSRAKDPAPAEVAPAAQPGNTDTPEDASVDASKEDIAKAAKSFFLQLEKIKSKPGIGPHSDQIDHMIDTMNRQLSDVSQDNETLRNCLRIDSHDFDVQRLVQQVTWEIRTFSKRGRAPIDAWHDARP